ncbi:MAG: prepilin peptidase [Oscillospiraceae bacterium]|nr:prepilin peptidase [Oscillospiraceae bacterium]
MEPVEIIILVFSCALGACMGSFVNAAALRAAKKESFVRGRSKCPECGKTLRWFELIPVVSWLALRGRCRGCKARISPRYPLAEVACALPAALCFIRYRFSLMTPLAFCVCVLLLAVALTDMETMEIPGVLILALIPFAAGAVWAQPDVTLLGRGIGLAAVSVPMLALALIISGAFGERDIELMAVCGFLLGWQNTLLAFFLAVLTGGGYAMTLMLRGKKGRGEHMAFGPHLCAGVTVAMLFGKEIISGYLGLFGL